MAARNVSAVLIKKLYYGAPLTSAPTKAGIEAALTAATPIPNAHQGTFQYEEAEATINRYKNQLTGQVYRSNVSEPGVVTMSFTVGQYDFALKAALQGGTATADSWIRGNNEQIHKAMYAVTEDDVCIVFPNAGLVARGASTDEAIGLALSAVPEEARATDGSVIAPEFWFDIKA